MKNSISNTKNPRGEFNKQNAIVPTTLTGDRANILTLHRTAMSSIMTSDQYLCFPPYPKQGSSVAQRSLVPDRCIDISILTYSEDCSLTITTPLPILVGFSAEDPFLNTDFALSGRDLTRPPPRVKSFRHGSTS